MRFMSLPIVLEGDEPGLLGRNGRQRTLARPARRGRLANWFHTPLAQTQHEGNEHTACGAGHPRPFSQGMRDLILRFLVRVDPLLAELQCGDTGLAGA
jgi:hypothetical protein